MNTPYIPSIQSNWNDMAIARMWAHKAVQWVAMVPRGILPPDPGDTGASLQWDSTLQMLLSQAFGTSNFQTALRVSDLSMHIMGDGETLAELELSGLGPNQILEWIEQKLRDLGLPTDRLSQKLPYEMPANQDIEGHNFRISEPELFHELSNYFGNADLILENFRSSQERSSEVRCWPHHFDIATLVSLDTNPDPESKRSIGVGFSPGDDNHQLPYYYITPWPYPDISASPLPPFTGAGKWNTDGWVGALLMADKISELQGAKDQMEIIVGFMNEAVAGLKELMCD